MGKALTDVTISELRLTDRPGHPDGTPPRVVGFTQEGAITLREVEPGLHGDAIEVDGEDLADLLVKAFAPGSLSSVDLPGRYRVTVERLDP